MTIMKSGPQVTSPAGLFLERVGSVFETSLVIALTA